MISSTSSPVIRVEHLIKRYKGATTNAVNDISFTVQEGEFFSFLGPNGAGKTTTISILTTVLNGTAGSVTIAGHHLEKNPDGVRRSIGVIFQNHSLDGRLTVEENIRLHCVLYGLYGFRPMFSMMPAEYRDRLKDLLSLLDLWELRNAKVQTLSGGMKRKLEIVRSLFHKPKVLFLDEPTSGLDPLSRRNLWAYLHNVRKTEKITIFLTTHYLDEAENADRAALIYKGKILLCDTPMNIKRELVDDLLLLDSSDRSALTSELKNLKVDFTVNERVTVALRGQPPQHVLQALKTPLTHLSIHYPSLEEAYIRFLDTHHEAA